MKKIVVLSPAHPLRGGIAVSSERFAQELQKCGYEVLVFSFSLQYPGFLFPGTTQYTSDPAPRDLTIRTAVNSVNPLNWIKVGLELRKLRPDAIVTRYWLPFLGPCLGTILRIARSNGFTKTVGLLDNILPHEKRPGDRMFTKWFVGANDGFIAMSKSVEQDLRMFTAEKPSTYVPLPIYDNYGEPVSRKEGIAKLGLNENEKYLLFFGFIREYKGLDLLLQAMAEQTVAETGVKLIVAGEFYGNRESYELLINDLGIEDKLILRTDYIPAEEVKYYFAAADLIVQPYKTATQSAISQVAYHYEKPMVVTNVGGLPEIVPHGKAGYVVEKEPAAIAKAIVDFFTKNRAAEFAEGVKKEKKRFAWTSMVEGLEGILSKL